MSYNSLELNRKVICTMSYRIIQKKYKRRSKKKIKKELILTEKLLKTTIGNSFYFREISIICQYKYL